MDDEKKLRVVTPFPCASDVPAFLRSLAEAIERGHMAQTSGAVVVLKHPGGMSTYSAGDADGHRAVGMLFHAATFMCAPEF